MYHATFILAGELTLSSCSACQLTSSSRDFSTTAPLTTSAASRARKLTMKVARLVAFASAAALAEGFAGMPGSRLSLKSNAAAAAATAADSRGKGRTSVTTMTASAQIGQGTKDGVGYDMKSWSRGYESADAEDEYLLQPSEGSIPKDIAGTFFRNGPAKFKIGEDLVKHPFDGDGMVTAISFSEEGAYFRNRYIKTKGYKKEMQAGKMLWRGFGNLPGGPLKNAFRIGRKNLANTNVIYWGGVLLALWEGGLPHRLDVKSLDTFGETFLGETIDENRPIFSAHPRIDPVKDRLIGFGSHNMKETRVYEYNSKFGQVQNRLLKEVPGFLHDFGVTKNYYVFYSPPVSLNPLKWVLGLDTMGSALTWDGPEDDTRIFVVPRDPSKEMKTIPISAGFCFHVSNAYEDEKTGELVLDVIESEKLVLDAGGDPSLPLWDTVDFERDVAENEMKRYRMDISSEKGSLVESSTLYGKQIDFPTVNPKVSCQEHRYVWAACGAAETGAPCPLQGVVKVDVVEGTSEKWLPETHEFMGEPTFVPRKGAEADAPEDFGYIISLLVNGRDHKTDVLIFDAAEIAKGPLCRLPLKGFIPHALHGEFTEELVFTPDQIEKSFALTDLFGKKGWNVAKSEFSGLGLNSMMD